MKDYAKMIDDIVAAFKSKGYNPYDIIEIDFDDKEREFKILRQFFGFVGVFFDNGATREAMEKLGYDWPSIYPGLTIEDDWKMFLRWVKKQKNYFTVEEAFIPKHLRKDWTKERYEEEVERCIEFLARLQIDIHLMCDLDPQKLYEYMEEHIAHEKFKIMTEDSRENYCIGVSEDIQEMYNLDEFGNELDEV